VKRPLLLGMVAGALAASSLAVASSASPGATAMQDVPGPSRLYVAPDGSDAGTGSESDPFATFQHAVDQLGDEGGTVLARGGTYAGQRLLLRGRHHVTVEAYPGERPVLDLSGAAPPDGSSGVVEIRNGSDLAVRGLEITGYRTTSQEKVPMGIYVLGGVDGLVLARNHVHDLGNDNDELGSFDINAHGIAVYGTRKQHPTTALRIVDNEVDHLALGASESVVVNGNVKGWRITGNYVHDNNNIGIDAIGYEGTIGGPARWTDVNRARQGVIAGNVVTGIVSRGNPAYWEGSGWCNCADGIYVDGGKDILIRDNVVRTADIGIEVASEWGRGGTEGIEVRDNVVTGSAYVGLALGGYGPGRGEAHDLVVKRNVFRGNNTLDDGSPEILLQFKVYDTLIVHNKVTATNAEPWLVARVRRAGTRSQNVHVRLDHNDYRVAGRPREALFRDARDRYRGLSAWQHGTGQDEHSTVTSRRGTLYSAPTVRRGRAS
jgi:hypothetical protein